VPTAHVNDVDLYYEIQGDGSPVVLIPGLGTDVRLFKRIIELVARDHRVLAFDPRGAGRSGKPDIPYSIEMMADDTAALMLDVGIDTADILGFSMGGRIALALALEHRERVSGLVLVSTSARTPQRSRSRALWMDLMARLPMPRSVDPQPYYAHVRQRTASGSYDCTARLDEIHVPTIVLHGRNDRTMPYALAQEMHQGIRGSRLVANDRGHMFFVLKPNVVADAVDDLSLSR
jgi:pimeloyl-ACP methyl ester carboxylesterase